MDPGPPGILGILSVLFLPSWPFLALGALAIHSSDRVPRGPSTQLPPHLPPLPRFGAVADPAEVAHALDTLALIVAVQRVVQGADPADIERLRVHYSSPLRLAWSIVTLQKSQHVERHRSGLAGARAHQLAIQGTRRVHAALQFGLASVPPGSRHRVNTALAVLHRLAHSGAAGAPAEKVAELLQRVLSQTP